MWVSDYCKLCLIHSRCEDLIRLGGAGKLSDLLKYLAEVVSSSSRCEAFTNSYRYVRQLLGTEDPYSEVKAVLRSEGAEVARAVKDYLSSHGWDLIKALEFSAAANAIDTSVLGFEPKALGEAVWDEAAVKEFSGIPNGKVFIALDNAGEFEVDLVLAEALVRNGYEVTLVVRSTLYEIDVTYDEVIGRALPEGVSVMQTPGNAPPSTYVREGFLISKGIANAEAYVELNPHVESLHLLRAKCDVLAELLSVRKSSPVIVSGTSLVRIMSQRMSPAP